MIIIRFKIKIHYSHSTNNFDMQLLTKQCNKSNMYIFEKM